MKRYHFTGEIPPSAGTIYVERPIDKKFRTLLANVEQRQIPVLYGCRQSGKTSLALRLVRELEAASCVAFVDLRDVIPHGNAPPEEFDFLAKLCSSIATALMRGDVFRTWWDTQESSAIETETGTTLFKRFLHEIVLAADERPITIFLDEIDRVLAFGRSWEFLLDATYDVVNRPEFSRLRFVFVGLNRPVDLCRDGDVAKYQHFEHIRIGDFDPSGPGVITAFAEGLEHVRSRDEREAITSVVLVATAGQAFLTSYILFQFVNDKIGSVAQAQTEIARLTNIWRFGRDRILGDRPVHFDQPQKILLDFQDHALGAIDAYTRILEDGSVQDLAAQVQNALLGSGLAVADGSVFRTRSPIYRSVFDLEWVAATRSVLTIALGSKQRKPSSRGKRPRVLVLNIGGTLGMDVADDGRLIEPDNAAEFFEKVPFLNEIITPLVETPLKKPTDGANIVPPNWITIAKTIYDNRSNDIMGALVVSGTDTMAYAASAVAYALGPSLRFPVVFTGAQAPVTVWHADAQANMLRAALVASQGERLPEVVVVFNDLVLRAVRTEKVDDFRFGAFNAPSQGPLAIIGETLQFQLDPRKTPLVAEWTLAATFEEQVLKVSQYPGLKASYITTVLEAANVKGLLIESLGLGNVPVVEGYSLIPVIQKAQDLKIPVLITGRYPIQPEFIANYEPASLPLLHGAISAGDMAPPAALTKFMWAIAQADAAITRLDIPPNRRLEHIKRIMMTDLLGEVGVGRPTPKSN